MILSSVCLVHTVLEIKDKIDLSGSCATKSNFSKIDRLRNSHLFTIKNFDF
jgi:hypothetical protein